MRERIATFVKISQAQIVRGITDVEGSGAEFRCDHWQRPEGGEGTSCVLQDAKVFEKAGVNVSIVHGELPPGTGARARRTVRGAARSLTRLCACLCGLVW